MLAASDADLASVDGLEEALAKDVREGLHRLQEFDDVLWYLQS